jgi:PAS domain-containing protein
MAADGRSDFSQVTEAEVHHGIRLQAVLDTAVDGIMLIDAQGALLTFNPA